MAVSISSRKNTSFVVHVSAANSGNIVLVGNSTTTNVNSTSTCVAIGDEVFSGAYITQAFFGTDGNGHIQVLRGSTLVATYDTSGQKDYAGCGMPLNINPTANLVINFVGTSNAYCMLELQKQGTFISEYNNR
jgi:co-chaperonin GroES (HSP10)